MFGGVEELFPYFFVPFFFFFSFFFYLVVIFPCSVSLAPRIISNLRLRAPLSLPAHSNATTQSGGALRVSL